MMRDGTLLKRMGRLVCCGAAALFLCACGGQTAEEDLIVVESENDTASHDFYTVQRGDVELTQKVRCVYRQQNEEEVSFPLSGRIVDKVYVKEGQTVKAGDLLAELSVGDLQRKIEDAEYWIARNELLLEYAKENENLDISQAWVNYTYNHYYDKKGLDENIAAIQQGYRYQREDSEDALELDKRNLANLKQELRGCRVYAGIDGTIYRMKEELEGSTSKEDEVIMRILDTSECLFEAEAPEYAHCFKEGETVSMKVSAGGNANGDYEVMPYHMEEWGEKQMFSIFDGPMTSGLEVGTSGTILFTMDSREHVLCLPTTAVYTADSQYYVYVVDENDIRQIRWVELGLRGDNYVEILSGLEVGEKVIRK